LIHEEREGGASAINFTALEGKTSVRPNPSEEGFYRATRFQQSKYDLEYWLFLIRRLSVSPADIPVPNCFLLSREIKRW
jgi:hypothetical protein